MDLSTMVGGGAVAGIVVGAWDYVKLYTNKIFGLFFVSIDANHNDNNAAGDFCKAMAVWSSRKCKVNRFSQYNIVGLNNFIKPLDKNQLIAYKVLNKLPTLAWYKKRPIIISEFGMKITFLRGMFSFDKIIIDIVDTYNESLGDSIEENRFYIRKFHGTLLLNKGMMGMGSAAGAEAGGATPRGGYHDSGDNEWWKTIDQSLIPLKWSKEEIGQIKRDKPLDYLALSSEIEKVVDGLRLWRKSESWYKQKQIPHRRGILLHSKPGNGKSSIAKALAMELNMPIMIFDLTSMSNNDFTEAWDTVKNYSPCMALFEDIDAVFDGRKNVANSDGGLSFDCFLNAIDGVSSCEGLLIIVTTNNIDKIDEALGKPSVHGDISTRPGRIDTVIEMSSPSQAGLRKIANRILIDYPGEIDRVIEEGKEDTGAQFQERCSRLALKLFWDNK